jgi:hypothetical protein
MRKNVIIPIQMVKFKRDSRVSDLTLEDIKEIGEGTGKFMSQFKPLAVGNHQARELLVDDSNYSKPSDHYFTYLNTINKEGKDSKQSRDKSII